MCKCKLYFGTRIQWIVCVSRWCLRFGWICRLRKQKQVRAARPPQQHYRKHTVANRGLQTYRHLTIRFDYDSEVIQMIIDASFSTFAPLNNKWFIATLQISKLCSDLYRFRANCLNIWQICETLIHLLKLRRFNWHEINVVPEDSSHSDAGSTDPTPVNV